MRSENIFFQLESGSNHKFLAQKVVNLCLEEGNLRNDSCEILAFSTLIWGLRWANSGSRWALFRLRLAHLGLREAN